MSTLVDTARRKAAWILVLVGLMWLIYGLNWIVPVTDYGLRPRTSRGLIGIVSMPLLHAHVGHLLANTIPMVVLLGLLTASRSHGWLVVFGITLLGGSLLWVCGRNVNHIGASALISGLISFLVLRGWFERRIYSVVVAVVTFLLYGSTLIWGMIPSDPFVSWDGHLCGAVAGGVLAFSASRGTYRRRYRQRMPT